MEKINQAWVVAVNGDAIPSLTTKAKEMANTVTLFFAGSDSLAMNADQAFRLEFEDGASFSASAPVIAKLASEQMPEAILVESCKDGRLIAGTIAAACKASVFADVSEIFVENQAVTAKRMVLGGSAIKTEASKGVAVVIASSSICEAGDATPCESVTALAVKPEPGVRVVDRRSKPANKVDLSAEKYIVGVGRGIGSKDNVGIVEDFAQAIGAGIGCTRPIGEETDWFGDTGYLGISGGSVKPNVYIACGISGQVQHMVGINGSGLIFAINKDSNATIFGECDYGLVADMNAVIPMLTEKFKSI